MNNIPEDAKIYRNVSITDSNLSSRDIVGEDSIISDSCFGRRVSIGRRNIIDHVEIGEGSYTNDSTVIKHAVIGKFCSISWKVSIGGANHDFDRITTCPLCRIFDDEKVEYKSFQTESLVIGNDVWIGAGAHILRGVTIGDGAVVGANSVVTKDIPPYEIWAGVPARFVKKRFSDDIIQMLLKIQWWDFDREKIEKIRKLFKVKIDQNIVNQLLDLKEE